MLQYITLGKVKLKVQEKLPHFLAPVSLSFLPFLVSQFSHSGTDGLEYGSSVFSILIPVSIISNSCGIDVTNVARYIAV
jgi:hypothetical protein